MFFMFFICPGPTIHVFFAPGPRRFTFFTFFMFLATDPPPRNPQAGYGQPEPGRQIQRPSPDTGLGPILKPLFQSSRGSGRSLKSLSQSSCGARSNSKVTLSTIPRPGPQAGSSSRSPGLPATSPGRIPRSNGPGCLPRPNGPGQDPEIRDARNKARDLTALGGRLPTPRRI